MRTLIALAALASVMACSQETTTETPDTTSDIATTPAAPPAPTVIVLTEADARTRAETAGYSNVTGLVQNADGTWTATGTQNGATTSITITDMGVTTMTTPAPTP